MTVVNRRLNKLEATVQDLTQTIKELEAKVSELSANERMIGRSAQTALLKVEVLEKDLKETLGPAARGLLRLMSK